MSIAFNPDRWEQIRYNYREWWAGRLKRPLLNCILREYPADRPEPAIPAHRFTSFYDPRVPSVAIVDRWDYDLSQCRFLGDGFPAIWPNFGAGICAAFLGATLENTPETVWFHPPQIQDIDDLKFNDDPENRWFHRIADLYRAGLERWQGRVLMQMTDLGGALDILSTFRPSERLLLDLYDHPETVKRLTWQLHEVWWRYFEAFNKILQPVNPGYGYWARLYSEVPYAMLQCDFSYMIGPDMFREFVLPELQASCRRLGNAFYHLDGVGELPHVDALLSIPELKGIQWIPGAGRPDASHWPELYRKIRAAGKLIQIHGDFRVLADLEASLGTLEGICVFIDLPATREIEARDILRRYQAING